MCLRIALQLELATMTLGQYVVSSQIIPVHCVMILKDMIELIIKNSMLIYILLKDSTRPSTSNVKGSIESKKTSQVEIKKIEENNESLILSLNSICDILSQHNKQLMRNMSDMNLAVGQTIKPMQSICVHTPVVNIVQNLLKNLPSTLETKDSLLASLETSVKIK